MPVHELSEYREIVADAFDLINPDPSVVVAGTIITTGRNNVQVYGKTIDDATRCIHYHTQKDIVAIKFACCARYYPCFDCHKEGETHSAQQWPEELWSEKAILCGVCRTEMTIIDYRQTTHCLTCGADFNERCRNHAHLYFHLPAATR